MACQRLLLRIREVEGACGLAYKWCRNWGGKGKVQYEGGDEERGKSRTRGCRADSGMYVIFGVFTGGLLGTLQKVFKWI